MAIETPNEELRKLVESLTRGTRAAAGASAGPLPKDLLQALEQERAAYRGIKLKELANLAVESTDLFAFDPSPAADESWNGGTVLGFKDAQLRISGDVVHVDAGSGRVFVSPHAPAGIKAESLDADSWCYKPFDFSDAILAAAAAVPAGERLDNALRFVRGELPARDVPCANVTEAWRSAWGTLWGPPGTGKTESTARTVIKSIWMNPDDRILAVAPTNRAVDELTLRIARGLKEVRELTKAGVCRVFRGGKGAGEQLAREFPEVLHDSEYQKRTAEIQALEHKIAQLTAKGGAATEVAALRKRVADLRKTLADETLFAAREGRSTLILVTVHRALRLASELGADSRFSRVVIDEAGMVPRAAAALIAPLGPRVFLAGDPKQIGPISRAPEGFGEAVNRWLRSSPMTHLANPDRDERKGDVHLLTTQYRMHPQICAVVSNFAYGGRLKTADFVAAERGAYVAASLPQKRACWLVLDECVSDPRRTAFTRAQIGRGYERAASAELTVEVARLAIAERRSVLALTPYRAQAARLRGLGAAAGFDPARFTASTIHKQQGTEADVVVIDTVAGGRPFAPSELSMILNVAASRARHHLFLVASRDEVAAPINGRLAQHLTPVVFAEGAFREEVAVAKSSQSAVPFVDGARTLAEEIAARRVERPLFSAEQVELFERRVDEGHHLVRGVAGSGKTFVLAHWLARTLEKKPRAAILVSYFNKALRPLLESLVSRALVARLGEAADDALGRVSFVHVDAHRQNPGLYDAVFVDEAQDMDAAQIRALYESAKPSVKPDGTTGHRPFYLFLDDSQNIRGNLPLDEIKAELPASLSFSGRVRVLREAFRSTREVLDLAFNCVLDPHAVHGVRDPGMKQFMKSKELLDHGLLATPEASLDGLYHVAYTERTGLPPHVASFDDELSELRWLGSEIKRLISVEGVAPKDILVVKMTRPRTIADALTRAGVKAVAFGGDGEPTEAFPVRDFPFVRVTTIASCKGHEAPIVFLAGVGELDDLSWFRRTGEGDLTDRGLERRSRAYFYVGATRALYRQYISGRATSRFVRVAQHYAQQAR